MKNDANEHTLEFLLAFNGRIHRLEEGYWMKFEIRRIEPTDERPHGLYYSFTLHDPDGIRLIGFDNAHPVPRPGSRFKQPPIAADHWHRTQTDAGRPYEFSDAETLIDDFFDAVERFLSERGISTKVVDVEDKGKAK